MTRSCQTERHRQHRRESLDVEAADPGEARIDRDVLDRDRLARRGDTAGDPLADREADPPDLGPIEAVRRSQRQSRLLAIGEIERADLDIQGRRGPVDDRPHQLVPVARLGRELGDLVEEREFAEAAFGPHDVRRHGGIIGQARRAGVLPGAKRSGQVVDLAASAGDSGPLALVHDEVGSDDGHAGDLGGTHLGGQDALALGVPKHDERVVGGVTGRRSDSRSPSGPRPEGTASRPRLRARSRHRPGSPGRPGPSVPPA